MPEMDITAAQFEFVRRLLEEQVGIALEADQEIFVATRLIPVVQRLGCSRMEQLISRLMDRNDRILAQEVIEALVTHETSFFRDPSYFIELTEHILPRLIARRRAERHLVIWCAACSTGQEAYSLAIILRERFAEQLRDWNVELHASDVSSRAIDQARAGRYTDVEIHRGLSEGRLNQHFRRDATGWRIDHRLQQMVRFQQLNLTGTWPLPVQVDLVLLRNVLIYMSPATRQSVLNRMQRVLHPEGCLMLGSTEVGNDLTASFATPR
jgi:chemotaxis protein methyltransferase CheR